MRRQHYTVVIFFALEILLCQLSFAEWSYHGLRGKTIEVLRAHNGFLYAGTDAGLYRKRIGSSDTTWVSLGLESKHARALLIVDDSTFIASVRITRMGSDTISVFKSLDAGGHWFPYQNGFGGDGYYEVMDFAMLCSQPNVMYAVGGAVAKSTNGGMSWRRMYGNFWNVAGFNFITIDAARPNVIWSGGYTFLFIAFIDKSTSFGESWQRLPMPISWDNQCLSIALDSADSMVAYVGMQGGIIKTLNGGTNWSVIFAPSVPRAFYGVALSRNSLLYAAGEEDPYYTPQRLLFYKSSNGGASWDTVAQNIAGVMGVKVLLVLPGVGVDNLFFGTLGGGVFSYANVITSVHGVTEHMVPERFSLQQNYPNPFNSGTIIRFDVARSARVRIDVFDMLGRIIETIVDTYFTPGEYSTHFAPRSLSTGIYFYRMHTYGFVDTKKFLLVR